MSSALWLCAGLAVGLLNVALIAGTVGRLRPAPVAGDTRLLWPAFSMLLSGFVLRLILAALVLIGALQYSVTAGLLAFAGLWLARWTALLWQTRRTESFDPRRLGPEQK